MRRSPLAERGGAVVAGAGVDAVEHDHALAPQKPDRRQDDDDGDELQKNPQPHQLLRFLRRAAVRHIDEAEHKHEPDRPDGDRYQQNNREIPSSWLVIASGAEVRSDALMDFEGRPIPPDQAALPTRCFSISCTGSLTKSLASSTRTAWRKVGE